MSAHLSELGLSFVAELEAPDKLMPYREALQRIQSMGGFAGEIAAGSPWPGLIRRHGFYTVITEEFMRELVKEMLQRRLMNVPAIEVCAGRGVLSYQLHKAGMDIVAIDNGSDEKTRERSFAPVTDTLDHRQALEKYRPRLVVGCWLPSDPEIGQDILNFPSVDYFLDIAEPKGGNSWLTDDYVQNNFKLMHLHNVSRYAIGTSDYFSRDDEAVRFNRHTEARLWKRKGAPMKLNHEYALSGTATIPKTYS